MACAAYLASIVHMQVRKLWQWSCARASRSIKPARAHYEFYISAIFQILLWQDHAPLIPKLPTWDATQAEALLKQAEAHGDNDSLPELQTKLPLDCYVHAVMYACSGLRFPYLISVGGSSKASGCQSRSQTGCCEGRPRAWAWAWAWQDPSCVCVCVCVCDASAHI